MLSDISSMTLEIMCSVWFCLRVVRLRACVSQCVCPCESSSRAFHWTFGEPPEGHSDRPHVLWLGSSTEEDDASWNEGNEGIVVQRFSQGRKNKRVAAEIHLQDTSSTPAGSPLSGYLLGDSFPPFNGAGEGERALSIAARTADYGSFRLRK